MLCGSMTGSPLVHYSEIRVVHACTYVSYYVLCTVLLMYSRDSHDTRIIYFSCRCMWSWEAECALYGVRNGESGGEAGER